MLGWLIHTSCNVYFQIYNNFFCKILSMLFPTFLIDVGKNTATIIKRLIWFGFIFLNCYILSFFLTIILFSRLLPLMDIEYGLNFVKTQDRAVSSPIMDLRLEKQFYFCSITLFIPNMEINHRLGNFEINVIMVDKYGDIITSPAKLTSIYQSKNRSFINKILEFFWIKNPSTNMEIDVPLMENLPNNVMDIQGIFLEITERNILFEEAMLNFKANIQGMRHYLYYWYWTSYFIAMNIVANILFVLYLLIIFMDYLINVFMDNCCFCVRRKKKSPKEE